MNLFQPYSLLWMAGFLLIIVMAILFRHRPKPSELVAVAVIVLGLVVVYFVVRPIQTPLMGEASKVRAMIGQGKPVLLEFQSPYWIACTAVKPVVDRLEQEYAGKLVFIRINIQEQVGRDLGPVYGFQYTPTFIFFDEQGNELWRMVGQFDEALLRTEMSNR